jgi:hypothetical protein
MPEFLYKAAPFLIGATFAFILGHAGWRYWFRGESRQWPSVRGKMLVARITRADVRDDDGGRDEYFDVEVQYEYQVHGKAYISTRYSFGQERFSSYDGAMEALQGIAAGREVPVYYDPSYPQRAVLRKG